MHNTIEDKSRPRFVFLREENESQYVPHSFTAGASDDDSVHISSVITPKLHSENV
jgi:hypothetical protein